MKNKKIICAIIGCIMIFISVFCFVQSSREADRAMINAGTGTGLHYYGDSRGAFRNAFEGAHHKENEQKYRNAGIGSGIVGIGFCIGSFVFYKKEKEELEK